MAGERLDVLAVDDDPSDLLSLEAVLADLGANLVTARSGDEAVLRVLERDFALVLIDVHLPGLDGFETARFIRSQQRSRHLPVIFLAACEHDRGQVQRGCDLGPVDFLGKPIVTGILKAKVAFFLDLHRRNAEGIRQAHLLRDASRREHQQRLEARVHRERLRALVSVANLLRAESDPAIFVPAVCGELAERLGFDLGCAHLFDEAERTDRIPWRMGLGAGPCDDGALIRIVCRRRRPVVLQRIQENDDPLAARYRAAGAGAGACVPLLAGRRLVGALAMATAGRQAISEDELAVLQVGGDQLAIALDRADLMGRLRRSAEELRAADRRKDEFLAMLAHELRNPLAPIVNALGRVRRSTPEGDPALRSVAAAERQALHLARLVDDLLDVSRITEGKIVLRPEKVELRSAIDPALQTVGPLIESKRHHLELSLPDGPVLLDVDANRLAQVVANLLHNAAKYTDPGGSIRVRAAVEGRELTITVEDDGVGIAPSMLGQVFDTFVQIDPGSDRARGGLGLGLTLVRTLVELHGGRVSASSDGPGKGSRFSVRLPVVVQAEPGAQAPPSQEERPVPARRKILLVEDNEDIRVTLRDLLEFEGHEVSEAADGRAGAEMILQQRPNVALVDIGLPGMDGYQVAQHVRRGLPGSAMHLVALTGYGGADVARKAREAGFDAHLTKPVKVEELFRLLGELT